MKWLLAAALAAGMGVGVVHGARTSNSLGSPVQVRKDKVAFCDFYRTFFMLAPRGWAQNPSGYRHNGRGVVLAISCGAPEKEHVTPGVVVHLYTDDEATLDQEAEAMSHLGKDAKVEKGMLDGEEARVVTYVASTSPETKVRGVIARHDGKMYTVLFQCQADEWEQWSGKGEEMVGTFHWLKNDRSYGHARAAGGVKASPETTGLKRKAAKRSLPPRAALMSRRSAGIRGT